MKEIFPEGCKGWDCKYFGTARINNEDKDCCLATGELILIEDMEKCPLKTEEVEQVEVTNEQIIKVCETINKSYEVVIKLNDVLVDLKKSFDNEDLIALIKGKTGMPKRDIRAVLEAIDKTKTVGKKYALKKLIATIGNVNLRDVMIVLDVIERLKEKYSKEGRDD